MHKKVDSLPNNILRDIFTSSIFVGEWLDYWVMKSRIGALNIVQDTSASKLAEAVVEI